MEDHFRVASGLKDMAKTGKLFPELNIVVYLTVMDNEEARAFITHRLAGVLRKIDDRKARVPEPDITVHIIAAIVRATMTLGAHHGFENILLNGRFIQIYDTRYAAHNMLTFQRFLAMAM